MRNFCQAFCWALLLLPGMGRAQQQVADNTLVNFGVSLTLGTHVDRMGLFIEAAYLVEGQLQFSGSLRTYYNFRSYGPPLPRDELQFSLGGLLGFGPDRGEVSRFFSAVSNQTGRANSVCYVYNFYLDNIGTSQRTATIGLQFSQFSFLFENDAFADGILDRFRTGAVMLAWEEGDTRVGLNSVMWTGDPASRGRRNLDKNQYPRGRYGAVDLRDAQYGRYSHGILALQVQRRFEYGQVARLDLGIDAEQVRHGLQNRFIHDAMILPEEWTGKVQNRHVPMLTSDGQPFVFDPGQKIRKPRFVGLFSLNPGVFY